MLSAALGMYAPEDAGRRPDDTGRQPELTLPSSLLAQGFSSAVYSHTLWSSFLLTVSVLDTQPHLLLAALLSSKEPNLTVLFLIADGELTSFLGSSLLTVEP